MPNDPYRTRRQLEEPRWQDQAACLGADYELFGYHPKNPSHDIIHPKTAKALQYCARCPVVEECLNEATSNPYWAASGVWGGRYITEREAMQNVRKARERAGLSGVHRDYMRNEK